MEEKNYRISIFHDGIWKIGIDKYTYSQILANQNKLRAYGISVRIIDQFGKVVA